ncbi:helix-turn-helix domain-containing protein [Lysinibacillus sp. fkY74-1]
MIVKSNLKYILDSRGLSIRELERMSGITFETLRKLANNTTVQYHRDTIAKVCEVLEIELHELLYLDKEKGSD